VTSISRKYQIQYYPYFLYLAPNSNGERGQGFTKNARDYDSFKEWIQENMVGVAA